MDRLRLSPADTILFGIAIACLLFTLGYYLTGLQVEYRSGFAVEDGPVEWGTAICLFIASLVLLRNALRLVGRDRSGGVSSGSSWRGARQAVTGASRRDDSRTDSETKPISTLLLFLLFDRRGDCQNR